MKELGELEGSEKNITIVKDGCWPQTAKQEGDMVRKQFLCSIWKKRHEHPNVVSFAISNTNGVLRLEKGA